MPASSGVLSIFGCSVCFSAVARGGLSLVWQLFCFSLQISQNEKGSMKRHTWKWLRFSVYQHVTLSLMLSSLQVPVLWNAQHYLEMTRFLYNFLMLCIWHFYILFYILISFPLIFLFFFFLFFSCFINISWKKERKKEKDLSAFQSFHTQFLRLYCHWTGRLNEKLRVIVPLR